MIQIENRAEESDDGEDDDHAAYYLIDYDDAVGIKLVPNLVDEPGESEPPQQGSEDDAEIPYSHFYRHIRYDESILNMFLSMTNPKSRHCSRKRSLCMIILLNTLFLTYFL